MRERRVACNVMGTFILLSAQRAAHRADDDEDSTGPGEFVELVHGDLRGDFDVSEARISLIFTTPLT